MKDDWYVPTNNEDKLAAVEQALKELPGIQHTLCQRVRIELLDKPPLRQPSGFTQIYNAAMLRAHRSAERYGDGYHVGIQSGLVSHEIGKEVLWMDQACVFLYVKNGLDMQFSSAWSATVSVPVGMAERVKNGLNELGAIVEYYSKRQDKDAVAFFSRHCARRRDFIADAVLSAFGSLSFKQNLEELPTGPVLQFVRS